MARTTVAQLRALVDDQARRIANLEDALRQVRGNANRIQMELQEQIDQLRKQPVAHTHTRTRSPTSMPQELVGIEFPNQQACANACRRAWKQARRNGKPIPFIHQRETAPGVWMATWERQQ